MFLLNFIFIKVNKYHPAKSEIFYACCLSNKHDYFKSSNVYFRVFKVITQLASSAPSDCVPYMDSICDNSDILLAGSEEIEISKSIQSAFHALFLHCSSTFVEVCYSHCNKLLDILITIDTLQ